MRSRWWHLLPVLLGGVTAYILYLYASDQFYSNAKSTFETVGSLVGIVGTAATFIEVVRVLSSNRELRENIQVSLDRKRAVDLAKLIQQVKDLIRLVEDGTPISVNTVSDITSLLRSVYADGVTINNRDQVTLESEILKIPSAAKARRGEIGVMLGEIKTHLEGDVSKINRAVESLAVRRIS